MKKIYSLIGAIAIFSAATAQTEVTKFKTGSSFSQRNTSFSQPLVAEKTNTVAAGDTVMKTADWLPVFNNANATLYPTAWGFVYGKNADSLNACGQYYLNSTSAQVTISKIAIMAVSGVSAPNAGNSYVKFNIAPGANNRAYTKADAAQNPLPTVKSGKGPSVSASSTWSLSYSTVFNNTAPFIVMTLTAPVTYTADFAVWADTRFLLGNDTVGFVSDQTGDGLTLEYALTRYAPGGTTTNYSWFTADAVWSNTVTGSIDNNIAFFPIVDAVTATKEYVNGIKLNAIYPNPTKDLATIIYSLENACENVSLTVFDITGKKVVNELYGAQAAGEYKINLNAANLEAGSYFYQLNNGKGRITKEFVITK